MSSSLIPSLIAGNRIKNFDIFQKTKMASNKIDQEQQKHSKYTAYFFSLFKKNLKLFFFNIRTNR